jgi:hypothetical protein
MVIAEHRKRSRLILSRELQQRRFRLAQALELDDFVVGRARLPALPDNSDPLEPVR